MKIQDKFYNTCPLSSSDAHQLADDLSSELLEMGLKNRKDIKAWFLREYCHLPYSFIAEALGYNQSSDASRATSKLRAECNGPISLNGEWSDVYSIFKKVATDFYDMGGSFLLELNDSKELEDAVLFEASRMIGYKDTAKNKPSYTPTPKYAPVLCEVKNILTEVEQGTCWSIWISDYNIKSNY